MNRLLLLVLMLQISSTGAQNLADIVDRGELRLNSWLEPSENIVVGQEVELIIEVSTQRWFAGGTRIAKPEIPQLVVLQRDQFASNLNRREDGISWVIQRWTLQLYPQEEGEYQLPPIAIDFSVNDGLNGVVSGKLTTQPHLFSAGVPTELREADSWVAAPTFEVIDQLDKDPVGLKPGDAITREIIFRASRLSAMMLPQTSTSDLPGLAAYPELPILEDRSNRGETVAERRETIVYVVEQSGQYALPEQVFYWWDTASNSATPIVLPAIQVDAGTVSKATTDTNATAKLSLRDALQHWPKVATPLVLLILITVLLRQMRQESERQLLRKIRRQIARGDNKAACQSLYVWLDQYRQDASSHLLGDMAELRGGNLARQEIEAVLEAAYGSSEREKTRVSMGHWLRRSFLPVVKWRDGKQSSALRLNPGNSAAVQKASSAR